MGTDPTEPVVDGPAVLDRAAEVAAWLEHRDLPPDTTLKELIDLEREATRLHVMFERIRVTHTDEH